MNAQQKGWETRRRRAAERAKVEAAGRQRVEASKKFKTMLLDAASQRTITIAPASAVASPSWSAIVLLLALIITGAVIMVVVGNG